MFQPRRDRGARFARQILLGIIEVGVDLRETLRELALQPFSLLGERLLIEGKSGAHLRLTARRDHLPQALRRRERQLTVQERALGKFPALGEPRTQFQRTLQDSARDLRAAVTVQFHNVLPREGVRRPEVDAHAVVEKIARVNRARIEHIGRKFPLTGKHFADEFERARAAHTDNGDAADAARRGDRRDEIVHWDYKSRLSPLIMLNYCINQIYNYIIAPFF